VRCGWALAHLRMGVAAGSCSLWVAARAVLEGLFRFLPVVASCIQAAQ